MGPLPASSSPRVVPSDLGSERLIRCPNLSAQALSNKVSFSGRPRKRKPSSPGGWFRSMVIGVEGIFNLRAGLETNVKHISMLRIYLSIYLYL